MYQVRIHGRGGQAVAGTAELLSLAALIGGRRALAVPGAVAERTGSPVAAYCRIAPGAVYSHQPVMRPDAVIVQDASLRQQVELFAGLAPAGCVVINSLRDWDELALDEFPQLHRLQTAIVPASELALVHTGRPLPGPALLAGFAALTGQVSLDAVVAACYQRFPTALAHGHAEAARAAYAAVTAGRRICAPARGTRRAVGTVSAGHRPKLPTARVERAADRSWTLLAGRRRPEPVAAD